MPRQGHCLLFAKPNGSVKVVTGTAFTPRIHPCASSLQDQSRLEDIPDEVWIVRINPQQWPYPPTSNKDIEDRQNELMGNLSLNKELDTIMKVNEWISDPKYKDDKFVKGKKPVIIRTIKMEKETADELSYSSKFDRSRDRMAALSDEGYQVALRWVNDWRSNKVGQYPEDAGYPKF